MVLRSGTETDEAQGEGRGLEGGGGGSEREKVGDCEIGIERESERGEKQRKTERAQVEGH